MLPRGGPCAFPRGFAVIATTTAPCSLRWLAFLALSVVAGGGQAGQRPSVPVDGAETLYQNTFAKDFIMDAPWRVADAATAIPVLVIIKDCDKDLLDALRWLRVRDVTDGRDVLLWQQDGADQCVGDDPGEGDCRAWITTVTTGHALLPDGTPLAPANLGYAAGDVLELLVEVRFRDNLPWDETAARRLRVRVGDGAFPWPPGWYGGDAHVHSLYTNNIAESGAPVPALRQAAASIGLQWVTVTDHSCDLDEVADGLWSYATPLWLLTLHTVAGAQTTLHDTFAADGTAWGGLGAELAAWDGPRLRLLRAVEINLASVDPAQTGRTLHALFYDAPYVASPLSGALGERPVTPAVPAGLDALAAGGFAYAAHPLDDLASEWAGVDLGINGAAWAAGDFAAALARDCFRGVEVFNTRALARSSDQDDPWADFDAGAPVDDPYPASLLRGIAAWDDLLRDGLAAWPPRRVFLAGGSDAHGDFDYATFLGLDDFATDNALGKVQTVVRVSGPYGPADLPPGADLLAALRDGRSLATDGPFLEISLDRDDDGQPGGSADLGHGDLGLVNPATSPPLVVRWASLAEFGPVAAVRVAAVTPWGATDLLNLDPRLLGRGLAGTCAVALAGRGLLGAVALRAELVTADGGAGHRAFTNPIWLRFDPAVDAAVAEAAGLALAPPTPNPANPGTVLRFTLPQAGPVTLAIHDLRGRRVRVLLDAAWREKGTHLATWDGRDERGAPAAGGAYIARLAAAGRVASRGMEVVR